MTKTEPASTTRVGVECIGCSVRRDQFRCLDDRRAGGAR
jgi:hypothetical protein